MTETSTPPQIPENDNPSQASPRVMLFSMLLLISGLILTSAVLIHYATDGQSELTWKSITDITRFVPEAKDPPAEPAAEQVAATQSTSSPSVVSHSTDSIMKKLFSGRNRDDGTVRWPKLKVTGIGKSSDAEGAFAIINGKQILVNTYIGEVKLVEIRTHGAVVEYKDEQKLLPVESR